MHTHENKMQMQLTRGAEKEEKAVGVAVGTGYTVRHKANAFSLITHAHSHTHTHARTHVHIYLVHFSSFSFSFRLFCSFSPLTSFFFRLVLCCFHFLFCLFSGALHCKWAGVGGRVVGGGWKWAAEWMGGRLLDKLHIRRVVHASIHVRVL